jgi:hypothetical protein
MLPVDTTSDEQLLESKDTSTTDSPEESAKEIVKAEKERVELLDRLASKVTDLFLKRSSERSAKEIEWAKCLRLYNAPLQGSNSDLPDRPFDKQTRESNRPEPNIIRTKCDTAISNSYSLQFAAGEKNWDLFPAANSTDPRDVDACHLMEKEIETQLSHTKYGLHCRRGMHDRVILGSGVVKGPVNTGKMVVNYEPNANGEWVPVVTQNKAPKISHVPLWRFYPDIGVTDFDESEDSIEIHPMTIIELSQYSKHPGFDSGAIKEILEGNVDRDPILPDQYNDSLNKITAEMWSRNPYLYKNRYVVMEYHGPITYDDINKLGLVPTYESPTQEYYGEVWVCAGKVIRMELENIEGHYECPYSMSVWKTDPSSPFGFGHPLLLADSQRVVTQAYHMILDNASLTSGPQVAMYKKYIQPVDGDWTLAPNKVWLLTDPTITVDNAIKFFNPTNVIGNIMPVLQLARQFAEEESATADFGGKQSPQNAESATGALIMQHDSTTLLDYFAEEWDDQVTEKLIRRTYAWNMQYNPKQDIKGNYVVDVKSSSEYKNKQMYIRDLERLQMETSQNPNMAMAINTDELIKARLALMHLPSNRIVRTDEEILQAQQLAQQEAANKPDPQMIELQIKASEVQIKEKELDIKQQQLAFEVGQQQQRELWEHQEKMGSNQARLFESQAQVIKARSEVEVEMIQMAQKDEQFRAKLLNDKEMKELETHSRVFLKSMEEQRKSAENSLYQQELNIKREFGSGI